ncbi:HupE/UreJ family protein [Methylomicrobium sp. Wu6]|uniref:HupE/UreJ family protein n=1 Tax=Methylomicrobium sp. Wu6 TaxID=3107928 RepID=UPI002DD69F68|nr:HupE/UreJ family protein [Methylomicrobium sp. Wu6]MEC4748943.1 HupE/UreJ family protein [Methylomicrobium sp. Wu6]
MFIAEAFGFTGSELERRFIFSSMKCLRLSWFLPGLLLSVFIGVRPALAHPVSQGAMDVIVRTDRLDVRATVSLEEVLVATALSGDKNAIGPEALRKHGDYLLNHLHVYADGLPLTGRLLEIPRQSAGQLIYRLDYPLERTTTKRIEFRQDVLREFLFAPGNPWEASYIVRIGLAEQAPLEGLLFTFREPLVFDGGADAGLDRMRMAGTFVRHGIAHIITGYDHLLFVSALVLAVTGWRDLIKVIAVFTLAHTLTLALAVLNIIRLPSSIVEPMIAASIVAVAIQNIYWPERSHGGARLVLAFGFGLFHGLGFAGGLLDAMSGMAFASVALAIIAFSVGVEIGHQIVVLPAFVGLILLRRVDAGTPRFSQKARRYGSAIISLFGLAYFYSALR